MVGVRNQHAVSQLALGFGLFRRKNVPHLGLSPHEFAGGSLFEALCSAPMGLHFRHGFPDYKKRADNNIQYRGWGRDASRELLDQLCFIAVGGLGMGTQEEKISRALDGFRIEIPSWGFANTGTRFGKYLQAEAAATLEEKFADAAQVNALTGACPTLALHVEWDLPGGVEDVGRVRDLETRYGMRAGSINPNLFQAQEYKFGSDRKSVV